MKERITLKIAKLGICEILLQAGFEKTSEEALNVLSEVFCYYLEDQFKKIKALTQHRFYIYNLPLPFFVFFKILNKKNFRFQELNLFLDYQIHLKNYIKEKYKLDGNNLLQMLKVLPRRINFKAIKKDYRASTKSLKSSETDKQDVEIDEFMRNFINQKTDEPSKKRRKKDLGSEKCNIFTELAKIRENGQPIILLSEEDYKGLLIARKKNFSKKLSANLFNTESIADDFVTCGEKFVEKQDD